MTQHASSDGSWVPAVVRLLLGGAGVAVTGLAIADDHVGRKETCVFHSLNGLPDALFAPAWLVMQGGTLGAPPVAAAGAALAGRQDLARRLLLSGSSTWALAKLIKLVYRRPRPVALLPTSFLPVALKVLLKVLPMSCVTAGKTSLS